MRPIRVLLADDHTLVRAGIRSLLESIDDVEVVAEAGEGREALELIAKHRPEVALLDIGMPGLNGLEVAKRTQQTSPRTRIIILSMYADPAYVKKALRAGAVGYLLKDRLRMVDRLDIHDVPGLVRFTIRSGLVLPAE